MCLSPIQCHSTPSLMKWKRKKKEDPSSDAPVHPRHPRNYARHDTDSWRSQRDPYYLVITTQTIDYSNPLGRFWFSSGPSAAVVDELDAWLSRVCTSCGYSYTSSGGTRWPSSTYS